eukprot:GILK01008878.1.p1 GENE.GILK01008878.1~~GILK01008878.1.p1  ORF type:complete len:336 (+),score=50.16 GILK01008878.1:40-1047(+)
MSHSSGEYEEEDCVVDTYEVTISRDEQGRKTVNQYALLSDLGKGAFSSVKLCENGQTGDKLAIKTFIRKQLQKQRTAHRLHDGTMEIITSWDKVVSEITIHRRLQHPNITSIYEVMDDLDHDKLYVVLELAELGPVMRWNEDVNVFEAPSAAHNGHPGHESIHNAAVKTYSETQARVLFRQLLEAVDYLHSQHIIHGDLKPDNILLNAQHQIKLSDFSSSRQLQSPNEVLFDVTGSYLFSPPECFTAEDKGYPAAGVDIWAAGVTLYTMLFGKTPFAAKDHIELMAALKQPLNVPATSSAELKELLDGLMEKDVSRRMTLGQALRHPWVTGSHDA